MKNKNDAQQCIYRSCPAKAGHTVYARPLGAIVRFDNASISKRINNYIEVIR